MNRKNETVRSVVLGTVRRQPLLCTALVLAVAGAVAASLLPPLVLGRVVDRLTARQAVPFALALGYFGLLALSGGLESLRESLLMAFGQRMTHALRSAMCAKLDKLPAEAFVNQESGAAVSCFVGDVDTVEALFTSGIISMFADACRLCGILAVIFAENRGLALILLVVLPLLYLFTRVVQKRMLKAQLQNRAAVARASAHVPETLRCIRTIHTLRRENYMEKAYDEALDDSFAAVEKTNFYDACYSPVILIMNAAVVALVMLFMLFRYRLCGLVADIALTIYIMIVVLLLALTGAQLTLPGVAGIILGIGMAVDANVVIFERIREEVKNGRPIGSAVRKGFSNALSAIIDSNVTTIIAAVVLYAFGTGSVRGFALTLGIGVATSLVTAVFVTHKLLDIFADLGIKNQKLYV